jgi:small subunit ribosomal protein S18
MSERAKIRARRVTGNDAQQQRAVARAISIAREMALLPYSVRQVTHRSKGKRDRDGRGPDLQLPMPTPPTVDADDGEEGLAPEAMTDEVMDMPEVESDNGADEAQAEETEE